LIVKGFKEVYKVYPASKKMPALTIGTNVGSKDAILTIINT